MDKEWISVKDRLPEYGRAVLISIKGTVQHVTFSLDGADDTPDWFEPYWFDHDDELKIWWNKVTHWMPLPKPPNG